VGNSAFERLSYGVGEGEAAPSAGEGDASVSGAFFFLVVALFLWVGDGDGDLVAAAVVEVAVVPPCCGAQEAINAMPIKTVIKDKTDFFICLLSLGLQNVWSSAGWQEIKSACNECLPLRSPATAGRKDSCRRARSSRTFCVRYLTPISPRRCSASQSWLPLGPRRILRGGFAMPKGPCSRPRLHRSARLCTASASLSKVVI